MIWAKKDIEKATRILAKHGSLTKALPELRTKIAGANSAGITGGALRAAFQRAGFNAPSTFLLKKPIQDSKPGPADKGSEESSISDEIANLVKLTKKPIGTSELCDKLDMSPKKLALLIKEARAKGVDIHIENDHVALKSGAASDRVQPTRSTIAPTIGETQTVAVISDLHLGSKYCLREQLKEFVEYAYSQGVRTILCPGDVLDGCYRHGIFEVSHTGIDDQAQDLFETLPQKEGLSYHSITGNHDFTFTEKVGVSVGSYLESYFAARGRNDLHFYGDRGAYLRVGGAVVNLWHPKSGVGYARSYAMQRHIEKYASGEKPHILLVGHWHVYCHVYERGVHGIACPTFQGGGSAFGKSLGGAPAIGGMILRWDMTAHGTMRNFEHVFRAYFELEKPQQIDDDTSWLQEIPIRKSSRK